MSAVPGQGRRPTQPAAAARAARAEGRLAIGPGVADGPSLRAADACAVSTCTTGFNAQAFLKGVRDPGRILWEAPLGPQQRYLVLRFGPNVSLGNVAPEDILALEALRCGLRGDTLKRAWLADRARGPGAAGLPDR